MASGGSVDLGVALDKAGGFGKFQYWLLLHMIPTSVTGVMIVNTITYIMPSIACEYKIPKYEQGLLFSSVYMGMVVGGLVWGLMADIIGRKSTLLILLFSTAFFDFLSVFTFGYWELFACKICAGFMSAGIMTTSYTYVSEFVSSEYKDKMTMGIGMVTALGYFLQPLFAIFTLPPVYELVIIPNFLELNGWKTFSLICALFPAVGFGLLFFTLQESPAFLLRKDREEEALEIVRKIYSHNTRNYPHTFPVKKIYLIEETKIASESEKNVQPDSKSHAKFVDQMVMLGGYPYLTPLLIVFFCQSISMAAFAGIRSHLATVITMALGIGQHSNHTIGTEGIPEMTLCELFKTQVIFRNKVTCDTAKIKLNASIYICMTIIGFCIFASFIPLTKFVSKIGKSISFVLLHYIGGLCIAVVPFSQAYYAVALLTIFSLCMQNCVTLSIGLIVNRVPTSVRSLTVSIVMIGGRSGVILGSMILPVMTNISCEIGFWSIAFLNIISLPLLIMYMKQPNTTPDNLTEEETKSSTSMVAKSVKITSLTRQSKALPVTREPKLLPITEQSKIPAVIKEAQVSIKGSQLQTTMGAATFTMKGGTLPEK